MEELWPDSDRQRCTVHRLRNLVAKAAEGRLITNLERSYPSAAACLAEDLPALCVHLACPLRLRKRLGGPPPAR